MTGTDLTLLLLNECQHSLCESVVLGARVSKHVDKRVGQRSFECEFDGCDAHLRAVAASLYVQLTKMTLKRVWIGGHRRRANLCTTPTMIIIIIYYYY